MGNTYNYLKTVWQNLKRESKRNPSLLFLLLVLWCIPLDYKYSSISLVLLCVYTLVSFGKSHFSLSKNLIFPVALFLLMALSLLWTRDMTLSLRALSKGLPLLLLPLCFAALPQKTPDFNQKIIRYYSYGIAVYMAGCFLKAIIRFALTQDTGVFFYHELVTEDVNAIHVSIYTAIAIFYFITKGSRSKAEKIIIALLTVFLILLSSKNIIVIFSLLVGCYYLWHFQSPQKARILRIGAISFVVLLVVFSAKIRDRFLIEYESNMVENSVNKDIGSDTERVYNVSVKRAWTQDKFNQNDFFPGTAFRVYQIRIFKEMLEEDAILFTGYGLNASDFRIAEKREEHELYKGYEDKNFHNEYIQIFAELGIFGLLLLLAMVVVNLKNALKSKDFVHISFAVLMISLFLTESFLSRQRGIVFFTMMYCLYNAQNAKVRPKKQ